MTPKTPWLQHPVRGIRAARTRMFAVAVAAPVLLLTACAAGGTPAGTGSPAATTGSTAPSGSTAASTAGSNPETSARPSGSLSVSGSVSGSVDGITTLTGTVTEGVESRCVVLIDDSGATVANLMGWDLQAHPFGSTVEVTGTYEEGLMTTCQQGRPFTVTGVVAR